ncbi:hypothetical protein AAFF_G00417400 [Aldrovandia affinis]|uniref:Tetraspanin n=1 Tax=Aldrovandia affinis TaxID=143900 RepID=A0AAD7WJ46_9TELE|nr:hypothetical protein AAFF_G00417400 [Aldrovandia affinis]
MAKVNSCFKGVFIFFNVLFGIAGGVILALAILGHAFYHEAEEFNTKMVGVVFMYVLGTVTLVIAFLGAYGAYKEKKWALIVFCSAMALGCCGLLRIAIPMMISRPQILLLVEEHFHSVDLYRADPEFQSAAEVFQTELKCCGLFNGYQDWGSHIPNSCLCPSYYEETDKCERVESSLLEAQEPRYYLDRSIDDKLVYKQPCFPIILKYLDKVFDTMLGIIFGFAVMAVGVPSCPLKTFF